jgi:acetyl esterase/lipase
MTTITYRLLLTIGLILSVAPVKASNELSHRQQYAVGKANDKTIQAAQKLNIGIPVMCREWHVWWGAPHGAYPHLPRWQHWKGQRLFGAFDPDTTIEQTRPGSSWGRWLNCVGFPLLGPYESSQPDIIRWQLETAKNAGLDCLHLQLWPSIWDQGTDFTPMPIFDLIMETAANLHYPVALHDEIQFRKPTISKAQEVGNSITRSIMLLKRYGSHPGWYKIDSATQAKRPKALDATGWDLVDSFDNLDRWKTRSGKPQLVRFDPDNAYAPYVALNNVLMTTPLPRSMTHSTLKVNLRHTRHQRGQWVAFFDKTLTKGVGFIWDSSLKKMVDGQGFISIIAFDLDAPVAFSSKHTKLTKAATSGTKVDGDAFAQAELTVAPETVTLTIGGRTYSAPNPVKAPLGHVVIRGNNTGYFDNLFIKSDLPRQKRAVKETPKTWYQTWKHRQLSRFDIQKDIVFKQVAGQTLDLCLFRPKVRKYQNAPLMVFIHGGGWGGGDKYKVLLPPFYKALQKMSANGIACAAIEYRRVKKGKSTACEAVVDCKDAVRFLIKHAGKFGLDPNRIGVWGDSAGGHLGLLTGLADNDKFAGLSSLTEIVPAFKCIVAYYPLTSFVNSELHKHGMLKKSGSFRYLIGGVGTFAEQAAALSPTELLKPDSPSILLLHGDKDTTLPIAYSTDFAKRAHEIGADVTLQVVKNARHGFSGKGIDPTMDQINQQAFDYIVQHLTQNED